MRALLVLVLASCGAYDSTASAAKSIGGWVAGTLAEYTICETDAVDCGHVYVCATPADNPLGWVEICIDDDSNDGWWELESAERMYGACEPTPRHQGICVVTCFEPSPLPGGRGSNAYNGGWCAP